MILSPFADDILLYRRIQKLLLELINKFSRVAGYKINIQKLVAFFYTNNIRKSKNTILLKITLKKKQNKKPT